MPLTNTNSRYGAIAKTFHWLIALGIVSMIPLGYVAHEMSQELLSPTSDFDEAMVSRIAFLFSVHKTIGVGLFFLALARIAWAASQPKPGQLNADRPAEAFAAELVHWVLYGAMVFVPLSGWLHHASTSGFAPIWWPFGQSLPFVPKSEMLAHLFSVFHWAGIVVLVGALILHFGGALKHHLIDRDATLNRMLPGRYNGSELPEPRHTRLPFYAALSIWAAAVLIAANFGLRANPGSNVLPNSPELSAVASDWQVQDGTLTIGIIQMGNTVQGQFSDWTAQISFEDRPDPGPAGNVSVAIAIGSLTLGTVKDQAMGPDFFDQERFPTAEFSADIIKTDTGYVATGPLTIRDQSVPVTLTFDLQITDGTAQMTGQARVDRLDFGIGSSMPDDSSLGFAVTIDVELTAVRSAGI